MDEDNVLNRWDLKGKKIKIFKNNKKYKGHDPNVQGKIEKYQIEWNILSVI